MAKRLIIFVLFAALAAGVYVKTRSDASERVKAEMLKAVELLELEDGERGYVREAINTAHPKAFDLALNSTSNVGKKFDENAYFAEIKRGVVEALNAAGKSELAKVVHEQLGQLTFDVHER